VSLLVVALRASRDWCEHGLTEGLCFSLRIVNVLGCEISMETGSHGSSSYPDPACCETCGCLPHPGAPRALRCGESGHGCRTLTPDTGHRALDTGHRMRGHRTRTGRADAGRTDAGRTDADGDADRATKARWASGHPGHHDAAGTARRTVLLWAAAAHAALGNHDGSAVRPPASAPDCRLHCQGAAGSLRRAAKRRLGALLSSDDFGSSVERRARGQVLWRAGLQRVGNVSSAAVW
jgi:hypothetical protein